jgi:hypothetical protein
MFKQARYYRHLCPGHEVAAVELVPTEHPGDCGPSEPDITAIFYPEHKVASVELVPTEHPGDCGPSEPDITAIFYP